MRRNARLPRALTQDFVIRELDDETLVYDMARDKAHCLNQTAALVWAHCDGKTTASQAAHSLQDKLHMSVGTDLVWLAVKQLERFHLVEGSANAPSVSRRALVLKYAPAALALPVIMSITAPTPAGVASCAHEGEMCGSIPCCPGEGLTCDGICFFVGERPS